MSAMGQYRTSTIIRSIIPSKEKKRIGAIRVIPLTRCLYFIGAFFSSSNNVLISVMTRLGSRKSRL
jgi:hypothetical protein